MLKKWMSTLIDFLLPKKEEARAAEVISRETLEKLFRPRLAKEVWITAFFSYAHADIRTLIRGVKFYGAETPLPFVGSIIAEYLTETIAEKKTLSGWNTPIFIPIPSSRERLYKRGYNQAERFARHIYEEMREYTEFNPHALERKERKSQTLVLRDKRGDNAREAFFVPDTSAITNRHIILVDDVILSGSTLKDARRALLSAGAADVIAIAIAG